mmetsp:Transcript_79773/g.93243  ORF Transcript_79773/g.93243 Transcript_79773/m.93243 type:complete len:230 (-) Transcript_79773:1133-1822(-)
MSIAARQLKELLVHHVPGAIVAGAFCEGISSGRHDGDVSTDTTNDGLLGVPSALQLLVEGEGRLEDVRVIRVGLVHHWEDGLVSRDVFPEGLKDTNAFITENNVAETNFGRRCRNKISPSLFLGVDPVLNSSVPIPRLPHHAHFLTVAVNEFVVTFAEAERVEHHHQLPSDTSTLCDLHAVQPSVLLLILRVNAEVYQLACDAGLTPGVLQHGFDAGTTATLIQLVEPA